MTKQELLEMLRENLQISIIERNSMYSDEINIEISFDGEIITEDSYVIENKL